MTRLVLDNLPDDQAEPLMFTEMQTIDQQARFSFARQGLICQEVERRCLYQRRIDPETGYPCRSLNRWILLCSPYSNSTVHEALRDVKELADVSPADLAGMTRSTLSTLKQLSTKVRKQPEVIAAAKSQSSDAFVSYIQEHHPTQHILASKTFRCSMNEEQLADLEAAIQKAMLKRGCETKTEVLWLWALDELNTDDSPLDTEPDRKWGHA